MLEVKKLKKKFGDNIVLKGLDLKVEKGERIAIIGPSGCGKSTLLRCLNMIERPNSGQILFEGLDITSETTDLSMIRRKIGMVFQQFNLFPHLTVLQNVTIAKDLDNKEKVNMINEKAQAIKIKTLKNKNNVL